MQCTTSRRGSVSMTFSYEEGVSQDICYDLFEELGLDESGMQSLFKELAAVRASDKRPAIAFDSTSHSVYADGLERLFHRYHRKYVQTTDSEHDLLRAPNLLQRHFDDFGINEAWCGDITYIPTNEGVGGKRIQRLIS